MQTHSCRTPSWGIKTVSIRNITFKSKGLLIPPQYNDSSSCHGTINNIQAKLIFSAGRLQEKKTLVLNGLKQKLPWEVWCKLRGVEMKKKDKIWCGVQWK